MDPQTINAGLLMEAAEAHQQLAGAALKRLEAATRGLEPSVRETVRDTVAQAIGESAQAEFAKLRAEAQRTAQTLQQIRGGLSWNLGLLACAMSAMTALVAVGGIYLLGGLGSAGQAAATAAPTAPAGLRGDPAVLAEIARRGLKVDVSLCGEARRPCVKVDPKAGSYGPRKDLMVVPAQPAP